MCPLPPLKVVRGWTFAHFCDVVRIYTCASHFYCCHTTTIFIQQDLLQHNTAYNTKNISIAYTDSYKLKYKI